MSNIPIHTLRLAAAHGQVDPETVRRVVEGEPTRPSTRERAIAGLRAAGVAEMDLQLIITAKGNAVRLGEVADGVARMNARGGAR
jgi:hypothetical protein